MVRTSLRCDSGAHFRALQDVIVWPGAGACAWRTRISTEGACRGTGGGLFVISHGSMPRELTLPVAARASVGHGAFLPSSLRARTCSWRFCPSAACVAQRHHPIEDAGVEDALDIEMRIEILSERHSAFQAPLF